MTFASVHSDLLLRVEHDIAEGRHEAAARQLEDLSRTAGAGLAVIDYYQAICAWVLGDMQAAIAAFDRCGLAPAPPAKHRKFESYLSWLRKFHDRQFKAIAAGMPFFCTTSLPRSASGFLCDRLSEFTRCPVARLFQGGPYTSVGDWTVPAWVASAARGGYISHCHFGASPEAIGLLKRHGVRRIVVQTRDPRQAIYSHYMIVRERIKKPNAGTGTHDNLIKKFVCVGQERLLETMYEELLPRYFSWLRSWMECAASQQLEVKFVDFEKVTRDSVSLFREVVSFFDVDPARFIPGDEPVRPKPHGHFRKGELDEWRTAVPSATQAVIERLLQQELMAFYGWEVPRGEVVNGLSRLRT